MKLMRKIGKLVAVPFRVADLPFRVMREVFDDPEPEEGPLADIAKAVENGVSELIGKGEK